MVEGPFVAPTRHLPAVQQQQTTASQQQAAQNAAESAAPADQGKKSALLPGLAPLPMKNPPEPARFDARGKKVPTEARWDAKEFGWEEPVLPPSELKPPPRVKPPPGPFRKRLQSLFDDRPEAVDRLLAAAEARAALVGPAMLVHELDDELARPEWKERQAPAAQLRRLRAIVEEAERPEAWRRAAQLLVERLSSV